MKRYIVKKRIPTAIVRRILPTAMALTVAVAAAWSLPAAWAQSQRASQDVFWIWDIGNPSALTGTSTLERTETGISAVMQTSELSPGHAMTLWFIVFNNPGACATSPCSIADLLTNPAAQGDFLLAAGNIVGGNGRANFGGHLQVGDIRGSGFIEIGMPELAVGLLNPFGAEVHLAVHSHGPALSGQDLKAQISSYLGGCQMFLGNQYGIAQGPQDVPTEPGQCATIQASVYQP
jgi:hypothetical protein